jgi:hypothetical protein
VGFRGRPNSISKGPNFTRGLISISFIYLTRFSESLMLKVLGTGRCNLNGLIINSGILQVEASRHS